MANDEFHYCNDNINCRDVILTEKEEIKETKEKRCDYIKVYFTKTEMDKLKLLADKSRLRLSPFCRMRALTETTMHLISSQKAGLDWQKARQDAMKNDVNPDKIKKKGAQGQVINELKSKMGNGIVGFKLTKVSFHELQETTSAKVAMAIKTKTYTAPKFDVNALKPPLFLKPPPSTSENE